MKKIDHKPFAILIWLLLLVCYVTSAHAQPAREEPTHSGQPSRERRRPWQPASELFEQNRVREATTRQPASELFDRAATQPPNSIRVKIRYNKDYGYSGSGSPFGGETGPTSCGSFSVNFAIDPPVRQETLIPIIREPSMREVDGYYVCDFLVSELPLNQNVTISAGLGEHDSLTEAWMGGSQSQPPSGWRREIQDGMKPVRLTESEPRVSLSFEMVYVPMPDFVRPRPSRNRLFEMPQQ